MANDEHLEILRQGVERWNAWRKENPIIYLNLTGASLIDANLRNANLRNANLRRANLNDTDLSGADLRDSRLGHALLIDADLSDAELIGAELIGTNLRNADLSGTDLRDADLLGAHLSDAYLNSANLNRANLNRAHLGGAYLGGADLSGADLRNTILDDTKTNKTQFAYASCGGTMFAALDLSTALGLDKIQHNSPSTVGIDTLYKSGGNIPIEFLEGCGVPETMITFGKSLVGQAIDYYSCFISHSTADAEFCNRLAQQMKAAKLRVWYAPEDIKGGEKIYDQLDEAIRYHDKLIIVLSEASMNSKWVRVEIQRALKRERAENRRILFPIRLVDYDTLKQWDVVASDGTDLAEEIREYFIPNFTAWKDHDQFTNTFQRLLDDLRKNA